MTPRTSIRIVIASTVVSLLCTCVNGVIIYKFQQAQKSRAEMKQQINEALEKLEKAVKDLNSTTQKTPVAEGESFLPPESDGLQSPSIQAVVACAEGKGEPQRGSVVRLESGNLVSAPSAHGNRSYQLLLSSSGKVEARVSFDGMPYVPFVTDDNSDGEMDSIVEAGLFPECQTTCDLQEKYAEAIVAIRNDCHV